MKSENCHSCGKSITENDQKNWNSYCEECDETGKRFDETHTEEVCPII